jgi:hypothetical protein
MEQIKGPEEVCGRSEPSTDESAAAELESHQHLQWPVVTTNEELRRDGSIIRVRSLLKKSRLRKEKGYEHLFL